MTGQSNYGPRSADMAPIRRVANSRLFQLVVVVTIILLLDHYSYDYAVLRSLAGALKILVTSTVQLTRSTSASGY